MDEAVLVEVDVLEVEVVLVGEVVVDVPEVEVVPDVDAVVVDVVLTGHHQVRYNRKAAFPSVQVELLEYL